MNAAALVSALGGYRTSNGWMARCPAHDDRVPSLSIFQGADKRILFHCFAGCKHARVIEELKSRGLWGMNDHNLSPYAPQRSAPRTEPERDNAMRTKAALAIWQEARTADGTLVVAYLRSRGLLLVPPPALRFYAGLKHSSGTLLPAMVALVTRSIDNLPVGIHRTYLAHDGVGKAPVAPQKMMLGPCRGGVVRLGDPHEVLMVGEGLETCLAAMQATGKPTWAALSTSGMRALPLPAEIHDIIVLADGDDPGEEAAQVCARRWTQEGRRVRIARPPPGQDFNDMLLSNHIFSTKDRPDDH